jgi:hypothetical protein
MSAKTMATRATTATGEGREPAEIEALVGPVRCAERWRHNYHAAYVRLMAACGDYLRAQRAYRQAEDRVETATTRQFGTTYDDWRDSQLDQTGAILEARVQHGALAAQTRFENCQQVVLDLLADLIGDAGEAAPRNRNGFFPYREDGGQTWIFVRSLDEEYEPYLVVLDPIRERLVLEEEPWPEQPK